MHHRIGLSLLLVLAQGCHLTYATLESGDAGPDGGVHDAGSTVDGGAPGDAGTDAASADGGLDSGPPDAGSDAGPAPWGTPTVIGATAHPSLDKSPTMTADLTELYWTSNRSGNPDVWVSRRSSPSLSWGVPQAVTSLNTEHEDTNPEVASDGLTIWFVSDRPGGDLGFDVWRSSRPDRDSDWGSPALDIALSSPGNESTLGVHDSELVMLVSAIRNGGSGGRDVYQYERSSETSSWSSPVNLLELNSVDDESHPAISSSRLDVFFNSRIPPSSVHAIYTARRDSVVEGFGAPTPINTLNSASNDESPWVSPDGHIVLFSSDRSGNFEIYQATR